MNKIKSSFIKFSILPLSILLISGLSVASPQKMLTMNIHCYQDHWELRFNQILDRVRAIDPDVIAFQEVCTSPTTNHSQIEFIRNGLKARGFPLGTFESLYTHKAWDKFDEYLLMISKKPAYQVDKGLLPPSLLQRGYVGFQIDGLWYLNTHLEYREDNSPSRRRQLGFLFDRFKGQPHIISGDFNSYPESEEQSWLSAEGYNYLFPGPSHVGHDGNSSDRIDGYWLSPLIKQRITRALASIVLNEKVDGHFLSDHFGVLLEMY